MILHGRNISTLRGGVSATLFAVLAMMAALPASGAEINPAPAVDQNGPTILEAAKGYYLIGTAADVPGGFSEAELKLIKQNFNAITPENYMKPAPVHPLEDTWSFKRSDALVEWCNANNVAIHGHTLLWHAQTNDWFFQGDKATVTKRMKDHITTLVGRYKGKIRSWDVVNEAINDGGNAESAKTENLRGNSPWIRAIGPEFLTLAFKFAHEADPDAKLFYNDYNIENGPKHDSSMVLLKRLIKDGAPIYGVGIQGHWSTNGVPYAAIDKAIADYASLGLKVSISELDVTINGTSGGQFGTGMPGMRGPRGGRGPAGPAAMLVSSIQAVVTDLTDDQRTKLAAVSAEQPAGTAAGQQGASEGTLGDAEVKLIAILTPAQAEKWESSRLKTQLTTALGSLGWSAEQEAQADPILVEAAKNLAAAKDKVAAAKIKTEFWKKVSGLFNEVQMTQLLAPTFPPATMGGGRGRGNAGASVVDPANTIQTVITDLSDEQKAKLAAASADLKAKLTAWQNSSQRALVVVEPQYMPGQVAYNHELVEYNAERLKQNTLREELISDAELKMASVLNPAQAEQWEASRLNTQVAAALVKLGSADASKAKIDPLVKEAARKLAAAKDKATVAQTKAAFWKAVFGQLDETQIAQVFAEPAASGRGGMGGGRGPRGGGSPSAQGLKAQADAYAKLFAIFEKHKNTMDRITFWGLNDARTWRAGQNPLIFDANNIRKPAYTSIVNTLLHPDQNPAATR